MITVHHLADSRSQRILWLLEELGLDYKVERYERDPQTYLAPPALKALHPLGKAPLLQDGDIMLAETGAIIQYLLDTYDPEYRLHPAPRTEDGRQFNYWLHYSEGSAMPPLLLKLVFAQLPVRAPALIRPLVKAISAKANAGFINPQIATHFSFIEKSLSDGWFLGTDFSAADIAMSFPLEAAGTRGLTLSDHPNVARFLLAINARPAYQAALAKGGDYAYAGAAA